MLVGSGRKRAFVIKNRLVKCFFLQEVFPDPCSHSYEGPNILLYLLTAIGLSPGGSSTVQCSTMQYSAVQCSTVQYNTVQCSTMQYSTVQYSTVQCSTMQ